MAAPQGFEPRYADPESAVLPLNEGATCAERATLMPDGHHATGSTAEPTCPSYKEPHSRVKRASAANRQRIFALRTPTLPFPRGAAATRFCASIIQLTRLLSRLVMNHELEGTANGGQGYRQAGVLEGSYQRGWRSRRRPISPGEGLCRCARRSGNPRPGTNRRAHLCDWLGGFHIGKSSLAEQDAIQLIRQAIDRGITFMDNCWDYHDGVSEVRMGKALAGRLPQQGVPDDQDRRPHQGIRRTADR